MALSGHPLGSSDTAIGRSQDKLRPVRESVDYGITIAGLPEWERVRSPAEKVPEPATDPPFMVDLGGRLVDGRKRHHPVKSHDIHNYSRLCKQVVDSNIWESFNTPYFSALSVDPVIVHGSTLASVVNPKPPLTTSACGCLYADGRRHEFTADEAINGLPYWCWIFALHQCEWYFLNHPSNRK